MTKNKISEKDIIGLKFGKLTVLKLNHVDKKYYHKHYLCQCECGGSSIVNIYKLNSGHTKSCGCIKRYVIKNIDNRKHGLSNTTIYRVWLRMKSRCNNPNDKVYKWYGGRGLSISKEWNRFDNFYRDMGDKPTSKHTLERKDNSLGYSKENCRWATMSEQGKNRRDNVNITFNNKTQNITEWAKEIGISHATLSKRIKRWALEDALTKPKIKYAVHTKGNNRTA